MTPEEFNAQLQIAQAQEAEQLRLHNADVAEIERQASDKFGKAEWEAGAKRVVEAMGGVEKNAQIALGALAKGFDHPAELIMKIAGDEKLLKEFAEMSPHRRAARMAQLEVQMSPHGHATLGSTPAWATESVRGQPSDSQWKRSFGDELSDDAWSKEFDRRANERHASGRRR
jgi:hypothetical protein